MRKIPDEQIKAIQEKAKELSDLVDKADCRLIAYLDGMDWGFDLKVVPREVEMGERGIYKEKDDAEAESIDSGELQTTGLYGTVCNCEINSLYEEGECQDPYDF
jgi:hypothetical protein